MKKNKMEKKIKDIMTDSSKQIKMMGCELSLGKQKMLDSGCKYWSENKEEIKKEFVKILPLIVIALFSTLLKKNKK
jgi:hypothetical protein